MSNYEHELGTRILRLEEALREIDRWNGLNNDLDAYLGRVAEWGLGTIEDRPKPEDFGVIDEP